MKQVCQVCATKNKTNIFNCTKLNTGAQLPDTDESLCLKNFKMSNQLDENNLSASSKFNCWLVVNGLPNLALKIDKGYAIKIYVTDSKSIWLDTMSKEDFLSKCQESQMSGSLESILEELLKMASSYTKHSFELENAENVWLLTLRRPVPGTKAMLALKFSLKKMPDSELYNHVWLPTLVFTQQLIEIKGKLVKEIMKKDEEIAEYKAQNSINISRKNLITKPFNKDEFDALHSAAGIPKDLFMNPISILTNFGEAYASMWQRMENLKIIEPNKRKEIVPKTEPQSSAAQSEVLPAVKRPKREKLEIPPTMKIPKVNKRLL